MSVTPETASQTLSWVWPGERLVACGIPTDSIAAPVYIRREDDDYLFSAIGFQCARVMEYREVVNYLNSGRWEWELEPASQLYDSIPWITADEVREPNQE